MAFGFMLVTGFSPSMTRAGIVTALGLAAWYYGRKVHPLVLLPLAAAITVALNPSYVWGDIGWALSFAAFAGILILAPLLHHFFWGTSRPGVIREIFVGTMSAQAATLPIILFAFGQYSPYALLANVLVLPLIPLAMLLVFGAGIVSLILPSLAHVSGWPAAAILHYMTTVVDKIAALPNAQSDLSLNGLTLALSYGVVSVVIAVLWRKTRHNFRQEDFAKTADKLTT
jgi:competence protein ComEC